MVWLRERILISTILTQGNRFFHRYSVDQLRYQQRQLRYEGYKQKNYDGAYNERDEINYYFFRLHSECRRNDLDIQAEWRRNRADCNIQRQNYAKLYRADTEADGDRREQWGKDYH